ncbi:hypothetical protein KBY29_06785 [Ruegeria pomeroyi]|nr:hypothetical protein [Ruegeria pomeroyi]
MPNPALLATLMIAAIALAACDPGPTGYGTAPAGVDQAQWDREIAARRQARSDFYRGPRGGATGR